jgi:two-component system, chemotaxis family, CheB/CheR fusion protein
VTNNEAGAVKDYADGTNSASDLPGNDLATLLASNVIRVVVVDSELRIRHMSRMAESGFQVLPSHVGRSITDVQTDLDVDLAPLLTAALGDVVNVDRELRDSHGRWYRLQIRPHKTLDGRVDGAVLVLVDIDVIKKCHRELIDAVELTNSIMETAPDPVLVLGADLRIVIANHSFYTAFNVSPEATIGQHIYSLGDGQWNKPDFKILLDDVLPQRRDFLHHPMDFDFPGSIRKSFMVTGRHIVQDQDSAPLLVLLLADITLLKKTETALIKAEKLSIAASMAASVAHEINNPLHAITNLLYLASTGDDAEAAKGYAARALEEVAHVAEITRQTLNFYRQPTVPSSIQVSAVLDSLLALYKGKLRIKDIVIKRQYEEAPPILCLEGDLRQIFANIVSNAIDALSSGGTLTLRVHKSRDWRNRGSAGVRATISDSGVGMQTATRLKIYEAYFTTKGTAGTGLGMWISAKLVERLKGDMRVRSSTRPGRSGTSFSLFLPFDRRKRDSECPAASAEPTAVPA